MAERKRRGKQVASERRAGATGGARHDDDVLDEELAEQSEIEDVEDVEADADVDLDDDAVEIDETATRSNGASATKVKSRSKQTKEKSDGRPNIFVRLFQRFVEFVREVVAELRKVIWPTRVELMTYTTVVVVFVALILSIVGLLDYGFARLVLLVFGSDGSAEE